MRQTSLILASLGLSETALLQFSQQFQPVLAAPAPRKLALLVGINQYATPANHPALQGCLTDVELQREVLTHRFGFHPDDILVLTDEQATWRHLETAFREHLQSAGPQDVVVFHFSGYGCTLPETQGSTVENMLGHPENIQNALILADTVTPTSNDGTSSLLQGLGYETILSLLRSLATDHIVAVLDTGFTYPGVEVLGHLRVRSLPPSSAESVNTSGLASPDSGQPQAKRLRRKGRQQAPAAPGLILAATQTHQTALETQWHDVTAGLFTYALTQHLWTHTPAPTATVSLKPVATTVAQQAGTLQQPDLCDPTRRRLGLTLLGTPILPTADGILRSTRDPEQSVEVWLGGILPAVLDEYATHTCLQVLPNPQSVAGSTTATTAPNLAPEPTPQGQVYLQLQSRRGLTATANLLTTGSLQGGQYLQEAIRMLPRTVPLNVALGTELDRIERVDATSAFSRIATIAAVSGDQPANCIFTKVSAAAISPDVDLDGESSAVRADNPPSTCYGLCSLTGELLPKTRGEAGEAIKTAVRRLEPQLNALLATKLLGLTVNAQSSQLGVMVQQERIEAEQSTVVACQFTPRAKGQPPQGLPLDRSISSERLATFPVGSHIRYRISNYSDRPLYWLIFGIDDSLKAFTCTLPANSTENGEGGGREPKQLAAGTTLTLPTPMNEWAIHGPPGLSTTYLVCSTAPFNHTLEAMAGRLLTAAEDVAELIALADPLATVQAICADLHQASVIRADNLGLDRDDRWALDVEQWATFQWVQQVF